MNGYHGYHLSWTYIHHISTGEPASCLIELPGCLEPSLQQLPRDAMGPTCSASNRATTARAMRFGVRSSYIWDSRSQWVFHMWMQLRVFLKGFFWGFGDDGFGSIHVVFALVQIFQGFMWIHGNFRFFKYDPLEFVSQSPSPIHEARKRCKQIARCEPRDTQPQRQKKIIQFPGSLDVSKSSILIGFSTINHPFWGFSPYFWKQPFVSSSHLPPSFLKSHSSCVQAQSQTWWFQVRFGMSFRCHKRCDVVFFIMMMISLLW